MQTILIGFNNDDVHNSMYSIGIRTGYLLSSHLIAAGDLKILFMMKEMFRTMNFEQRVNFINKHSADIDEEGREANLGLARLHKASRKIKIKTKEQIVHEKKAESLVNSIFEAVLADYADSFTDSGLPQLKDLFLKPNIGLYNISYGDTEIDDGDVFPLSTLLQLKMADEVLANPTAMFLNCNLFNPVLERDFKVTIPAEKKFTKHGFLWPLLDVYNLNLLSVSELDSIMLQVNDALNDFKKSTDSFINLKSNPEEAFRYLQKEVNAKAEILKAALDQSPIIKSFKEKVLFTEFRVRVHLGMLPWQTIYKYLAFSKILHGKTAEVIEQATPPETLMPVLVLQYGKEEMKKAIEQSTEQAAPLTVKKSLTI